MRSYRIIDDSQEEDTQHFPFQMPLHALYASREVYDNCPPFQREKVWSNKYKGDFIHSLVTGKYVPDILITEIPNEPDKKWVIDGQQRLSCIFDFMEALEADIRGESIPRDEDGKEYFYFRLTENQEKKFRKRMIKFTELKSVSDQVLRITFQRLQNQNPLTTAEKLYASNSEVNDVGKQFYRHPFFKEFYKGKMNRRQPIQMTIYPIIIEMFKPFADMNATRLKIIASGERDDLVRSDMAEIINRRMDYVVKLFTGVKASAMTELIIMYQTVWLLDFIGADFEQTEAGALLDWYTHIEALNKDSRASGFMNLFAQFTHTKIQKERWSRWLDDIIYDKTHPICFGTEQQEQEATMQAQRVTSWLRHDSICPGCGAMHVKLTDVKQHVFRPADAHHPFLQNCQTAAAIKQLQKIEVVVVEGTISR